MGGDGGIKSSRRSPFGDAGRARQRNLIVELATVLPDGSPLKNNALPRGFPFLIDDDTHEIVEPALLFLVDSYLTKTRFWNRNTTKRAAYDLLDWWRFLDHHGRAWDLVDGADLDAYRDSMIGEISPRTFEVYKTATIRARRTLVRRFYTWARKRGWYDGTLQEAREVREVYLCADRDPLAHIHSGPRRMEVDPGRPRSTVRPGEKVRPLIAGDPKNAGFPCIAKQLGPLPSERGADDPTPSRDRLAAELSVSTGLRVDEVAKLTVFQILDLPAEGDPERFTTMRVTKTKRLVERDVNVPNYLIPDLHAYIDGERQECIAVARRYWLKKKDDGPKALFVNGVDAHQSAGKPVSADTLSGAFRRAVIKAGLTERITKTDPHTGAVREVLIPRHRYHDLRHTYALWTYHALVEQGTSEPWKIIQSLLGHAHLSTTLDTYLRVINVEKARTADGAYEVMRSVIRGD
jgi:integrase/recombinase XerC